MIPIYIASHEKFAVCEPAIVRSIEQNTSAETDIKIIRPDYINMRPTGCTGFTNVRFMVPELLRRDGYEFGIYLDVDMIVLGDIAELFEYRRAGFFVCMVDKSTEVAVISADIKTPTPIEIAYTNKNELIKRYPMRYLIPSVWNCEDNYPTGAKLLHFTDLKKQPWFFDDHPCQSAVLEWRKYANA